jgi:hypothetical protein
MATSPPEDGENYLPYAQPTLNERKAAPLLLCIALGLFSIVMLFFGVLGIAYFVVHDLIRRRGGANVGGDCVEALIFLAIGVFSGAVTLRWSGDKKGS